MSMTKEEFKRRWEKDGDGITRLTAEDIGAAGQR